MILQLKKKIHKTICGEGSVLPSASHGLPLWLSWERICWQCGEPWVRSLGWEDLLEKGKATPSSILTWRIPWTVYSSWGGKESDTTEQLSLSCDLYGVFITDETEFRNFIVWLEDQKIRHYKIEDRGNLRNIHSSDWPKFFEQVMN